MAGEREQDFATNTRRAGIAMTSLPACIETVLLNLTSCLVAGLSAMAGSTTARQLQT